MRQPVGVVLRRRRKELGLTLQSVVDQLSVEYDTGNLSRLERGIQGYTEDLLSALSDVYDMPVSQIYAEAEGRPHLSDDAQRVLGQFEQAIAEGTLGGDDLHFFELMLQKLSRSSKNTKEGDDEQQRKIKDS